MLHLDSSRRLSIDVDIVCPPGTDIREYLGQYGNEYGFTEAKEIERNSRTGVKSQVMLAETKWEAAAAAGGEP